MAAACSVPSNCDRRENRALANGLRQEVALITIQASTPAMRTTASATPPRPISRDRMDRSAGSKLATEGGESSAGTPCSGRRPGKLLPAGFPPSVKLMAIGKHRALLVVKMPVDRHSLPPLPALHRTHIPFQVHRDLLPGVEPICQRVLGSTGVVGFLDSSKAHSEMGPIPAPWSGKNGIARYTTRSAHGASLCRLRFPSSI